MPADIKTAPADKNIALEGATFVFQNEEERFQAIDQAFNYRGDVTLNLNNGEAIECYLFNRNPKGKPPSVELFVKGEDKARVIPYADIQSIAFTGKDTASGKSWKDWMAKKESERKEEADRIARELTAQGHL